ncbi:aspartyl protease family protein [Adhaeribacter sp. BT258]|uniref:Aspartyl protease family protein n=1 Tax=Adhaeribacter terrigena TaxID=2793070 RepID=A0ABS1C3L5_9BACT|nr:aspartyl protease family protein [Adhaeribacter terrigena]MBK0403993.1 aspartyl protease family protein [Adhaeribacter terrigena]
MQDQNPHFLVRKRYGFCPKNPGLLLLFGLLLIFAFPVQAQIFKFTEGRKKQKIPFQLHRNLIIVEAKLNGKGPFNFLVDTGVSSSLITDAGLRDSIRFSRGPALEIAGVGSGSDLHAYFTPDLQVQLPGVTSENLTFAVLSEDVIQLGSYIGIPVTGILGYDFFNSFVIEVDFKKLNLILHQPAEFKAPPKHEALPLKLEGNKPYLQTEIETDAGKVPVKLLLDTGAGFALSLDCSSDKRIKLPEKVLRSHLGVGLAGSVSGFLGRIPALKLGRYTVNAVLASFPDSADIQAKTTVSRNGSLGLELFKRFSVIFDYPHQKLYLRNRISLARPFEYDMCGIDLVAVPPKYRTYRVTNVHENSAAAEAGILPGDELLSLDLHSASSYTLTEISRIFHSYPDRKMNLLLKRDGQLIYAEVTLKRRI